MRKTAHQVGSFKPYLPLTDVHLAALSINDNSVLTVGDTAENAGFTYCLECLVGGDKDLGIKVFESLTRTSAYNLYVDGKPLSSSGKKFIQKILDEGMLKVNGMSTIDYIIYEYTNFVQEDSQFTYGSGVIFFSKGQPPKRIDTEEWANRAEIDYLVNTDSEVFGVPGTKY
jgi:hypothetical protein